MVFEGFTLDRLAAGEVALRVRYGGEGAAGVLLHGHLRFPIRRRGTAFHVSKQRPVSTHRSDISVAGHRDAVSAQAPPRRSGGAEAAAERRA